MINSENFIHKILIKYSYTAKIRFILIVSYFAVFMILVMNFVIFFRPLHNLENQIIGLNNLKKVSQIFEKMDKALLDDNKQDQVLKESISKDLQGLIKNINDWIKTETQNHLLDNTITISTLLFNQYWHQIKNGVSNETEDILIEGLYTFYRSLKEQISFFSNLTFNVDTGTAYLINTVSQDLPKTQQEIDGLLLNKLNMQNSHEFNLAKENLIRSNHQLFNEGNLAIQILSSWLPVTSSDLLIDLAHFKNSVSNYIEMSEIPFESEASEVLTLALISSKNELLETSFKLDQKLQDLLLFALQSEKYRFNSILWKCILILFFGGSLGLILYFSRVIRHPLENLVHAAQELSKGNIAIRIPITTKDEVALVTQAFNEMAEYYEKILRKAATVIDQIFLTSSTISSFTKEFESNMNTQERIVRQIASHAGSLQKGEENFVEILQKANRVASITGSLAEIGHGNLHEMEAIMHEMLAASSNVVATLSSLREKLVDIHQVIFAIVKIADQSNLLSLNTAIRATKSGSEGKGFVIIADKIKEMAEQIAFATLDIETVVEDIVGAVQITVQEVDNFSTQILTQVRETTEIGSHLKHLIEVTQGQVSDFEKINDGMQNQTKGIIAINQVIEELRISVQDSAFAVRKLYLEMEYLYDSSRTLQNTIKKFNFTQLDSST